MNQNYRHACRECTVPRQAQSMGKTRGEWKQIIKTKQVYAIICGHGQRLWVVGVFYSRFTLEDVAFSLFLARTI